MEELQRIEDLKIGEIIVYSKDCYIIKENEYEHCICINYNSRRLMTTIARHIAFCGY